MKRLILTSSSGSSLMRSDLADAAIMLPFRFVSGPLPSPDELASYVAARSEKHGPGSHWSDFVDRWRHGNKARKDLALFEFCEPYETIELRFDPAPNDQLELICLLDYFRSYPETAAKLKLSLISFDLTMAEGQTGSMCRLFTSDLQTSRPRAYAGRLIARQRLKPASICSAGI